MSIQYKLLKQPGNSLDAAKRGGPPNSPYVSPYVGGPYNMVEEEDSTGALLHYWQILKRNAGILVLIAVAGGVAALFLTLPQTPVYRAQTLLEIQGLNENFLNMRDLNPTVSGSAFYSQDNDLQTQSKILQSRAVVERVIGHHNDLEKRLANTRHNSRMSMWRKALGIAEPEVRADHNGTVSDAEGRMKVRVQPNTRILELSFDSSDPKLAADFANTTAAEFIEFGLDERWRATQYTSDWLGKQMQNLKIKLEKSEEELQQYARESNLIFTSEKDNVAEDHLKQLQEEVLKAQADRVAKQSRYELAASATSESLPEVLDDSTLKDYQVEITTLRRQLAELSSTFTPTHPKVQKVQAQIAAVESALNKKRVNIVARVQNEFATARRREALLAAEYAQQVRLISAQAEKVAHYNILKRDVDSTRQLYDAMFQRVKEAGVASALRASNIHVIEPARPPESPYKPNLALNTIFGLFSGFIGGIAFVVMRERSDRTIQGPGDAALYLNVSELGAIPSDEGEHRRSRRSLTGSRALAAKSDRVELTTWERRLSVVADAFRTTVTSILFSEQNGSHPSVIVVSSAMPSEGKTTTVSNLAIALAQANHRVLLIDGDLRRPRLHTVFDIDNAVGLSEVLAGTTMVSVRETKVPKLFLMPSGAASDGNLLFTPLLGELLQRFRAEFDMVLIDSPPLLQMPDARVLGRHADAVVLVVRSQQTTRDAARLACQRLEQDGTYVLGTILNDWKPNKAAGAYGYSEYYSSSTR